jgi:hypothetical protein
MVSLVSSLFFIFENKAIRKYIIWPGLALLILAQTYSLLFNSWIASSYGGNRTKLLNDNISSLNPETIVFFYQTPEAVPFLKHNNYYQYFSGTKNSQFGENNLIRIKNQEDMIIVTKKDLPSDQAGIFNGYSEIKVFDRYLILAK